MPAVTVYGPGNAKIESARPAVAVIDSRRRMPPAEFFALPNPVVAARRSTRAFRAPPGAKRRGAGASPHRSVIRRSNDAVLDDFDEVFDSYFNKLTKAFAFVTPLGRRVKFTGRAELTAPAVGSGCWSK